MLDDDYRGKNTGSTVGTLVFEDADFVIVLLPVGVSRILLQISSCTIRKETAFARMVTQEKTH